MMKPVLLNAEPLDYCPLAAERLAGTFAVRALDLDRPGLLRELPGASVLITRLRHRVDDEVLARAPGLRIVATATTGLDHVDLDACARRGVAVVSLQGETDFLRSITPTAELAWGLALAVARRIPAADRHVRAGGWDRDAFRGESFSGRTLGVIGLGRLGEQVARYGLAFGMRVLAHDPYREAFPDGVERVDLEALLAGSDVVSLHVPLNDETRGLMGRDAFARLKPGAILVNTSRGEVVDETALLDALDRGRLAGAGLDVLSGEGEKAAGWLAANPVWNRAKDHPSVVFTPHIGGAARDAMERTEIFLADKILRVFASLRPSPP